MKRLLFLILFLSVISCTKKNVQNANSINESLSQLQNIIDSDSLSIKEMNDVYKKSFVLIKNDNFTSSNKQFLLKAIKFYSEQSDWENLNNVNKYLLQNSLATKDTTTIALCFFYSGERCYNNDVLDSAFYFYSKAEKLLVNNYSSKIRPTIFLNKSTIQLNINDFSGAEYYASKALKSYRMDNDYLGQYDSYTNLGIASFGKENFIKAIEYHRKALDISIKNDINKEFFLKEISRNNIGNCYQNNEDYRKAIVEFELALQNKSLATLKPSLYATLIDNVAYSRFKISNNPSTVKLFLKSLKIRDSLKLTSRVILSKLHLSEYYLINFDTISSQKYANEALILAKTTNIPNDLLTSLKQLSLVEHKNAAKYSKEYIKISDSIQLEERKSKDKFARIAFETDEIILEKDKLAEQNRSLLYFFVGTLFVGVLLFVIRTQRAKNMELILKQQQQKANEDIYNLMISQQASIEESREKEKKRIAQELHDGVLGRLFGARLNLDSLNRFTDEEAINNRFNYLNELKNIEQDIREISHDLNREKYALINNFVAIVTNLIEEQKNAFSAQVNFTLDEKIKWDRVANTIKINLYRMLQEALQNCNKYANATKIDVQFEASDTTIQLTITDNGTGFDAKSKKKGIGLQNMVSRTNECKGTLEVKSAKGQGTTIKILIPLTENTENN
ncbi:MAG: sensor histidine kinase [Flavobacterium sp.]|nr:sensor histidine kinase [Flavobacterium sp.]